MTDTLTVPVAIDDMPEAEYHAHPALSSSGARKLLPPSCPARFKWERDNGQGYRDVFDIGHAAHALVLGVGAPIVAVDAEDWRTKAAKERRDEIRAEGKTPLLAIDYTRVQQMAIALRAHPIARVLFDADRGGRPEVSLFWHDDPHEADRRCRLDWLPDPDASGRLIIPDYKTSATALPSAFGKSAANYGYDQQADWNMAATVALGLTDDPAFVFVVQEKEPPYLVSVVELDAEALERGRLLNDRALEVFAECMATDTWPAYSSDVELVSLPRWATYDLGVPA